MKPSERIKQIIIECEGAIGLVDKNSWIAGIVQYLDEQSESSKEKT